MAPPPKGGGHVPARGCARCITIAAGDWDSRRGERSRFGATGRWPFLFVKSAPAVCLVGVWGGERTRHADGDNCNMIETKQQDIGEQLKKAVLQQSVDAGFASSGSGLENNAKTQVAPVKKGRVGDGTPGPGRPKGSVPKVVKTIREAVMEAFHTVGGPEYLVKLANGTQSDRAAFTSLLNKVLPTQINANVEGGIQVQLSWLGSRQIGTTQTQPADVVTQVVDLERDSKGKYRIADQNAQEIAGGSSQTVDAHKGAEGAEGA